MQAEGTTLNATIKQLEEKCKQLKEKCEQLEMQEFVTKMLYYN